jgi:hypothetical protein
MTAKHAKKNHRLQKTLAVSTASVLLPVLGVMTPAYAEGGAAAEQATGQAQAEQAPGQEKKAEQAPGQQKQAEQAPGQQKQAEQAPAEQENQGQAKKAEQEPTPPPEEENDPSGSSPDDNPDGDFQGKSPSTPDQDGIGNDNGVDNNDKTGEGTDGNNGCGNEPREAAPQDGGRPTEDDNNGNCGGLDREDKDTTPVDEDEDTTPVVEDEEPTPVVEEEATDVLDNVVTVPTAPVQADRPTVEDAAVLDNVLVRAVATPNVFMPFTSVSASVKPEAAVAATAVRGTISPTTLPFTGAENEMVALVALTSLAAGGGMVLAARRRETV